MRRALACLALALAARPASPDSSVMSKFTLRNLSGGFVGVWWIDRGGRRLIPQSSVAVRNTSNIEINSFRGHEFVVRRLAAQERLGELPHDARPGDAVLVVGATNDIVVIDDQHVRHFLGVGFVHAVILTRRMAGVMWNRRHAGARQLPSISRRKTRPRSPSLIRPRNTVRNPATASAPAWR